MLKVKTNYGRLLLEGGDTIPFSPTVGLRLGAGVGLAYAKTTAGREQQRRGAYSGFGRNSDSGSTTGFTWEIGPALVVNLQQAAMEFGVRYAQMPTIHSTDDNTGGQMVCDSAFCVGASF